MSRSGYSDDCDGWALIRWRGAVASAIRGRRGQEFLKELLRIMDDTPLPERRLIADQLEDGGQFCAIGLVGKARGVDMSKIDVEDRDAIAEAFGIAKALAAEIMFENDDEYGWRRISDDPVADERNRFERMRDWVKRLVTP